MADVYNNKDNFLTNSAVSTLPVGTYDILIRTTLCSKPADHLTRLLAYYDYAWSARWSSQTRSRVARTLRIDVPQDKSVMSLVSDSVRSQPKSGIILSVMFSFIGLVSRLNSLLLFLLSEGANKPESKADASQSKP